VVGVFLFSVDPKKDAMKKTRRSSSIRIIVALALSAALIIYVSGRMSAESISIDFPFGKLVIIFKS